MNWRLPGSFTLTFALCGLLASCQTTGNRAALPTLDETRDPAPPLHVRQLMQVPDGANASWDAFRGKVVLLEFWATWCGPCIAAIPHLNELAKTFADEPVVFLAITDEENEPVEQFFGRREMKSWIGFDDDGRTHAAYGVSGIPHTVIVDQHGRIAAVTYPTHVTEEVIRSVLEGRDAGLRTADARGITVTAGVDPPGADEEAMMRIAIHKREGSGMTARGSGGLTADGVALGDIIPIAYAIPKSRVEGVEQLGDERYTIVVNAPRRDETLVRPLLRTVLEATFNFETRREKRERVVYELRTPADGKHQLEPSVMEGGSSYRTAMDHFEAVNIDVASMVSVLEHLLDQPVYHETGIEGQFDITLRFDGEVRSWEEKDRIEHLTSALREQLGLDLVPVEREIEVLVITPVDAEE